MVVSALLKFRPWLFTILCHGPLGKSGKTCEPLLRKIYVYV